MKMSFWFELQIMLKNGKVGFVSKTRQWFKSRICSKIENLENGEGFYFKKSPFYNFDFRKCFKLVFVVIVIFNEMLVIVFIIDFYPRYGPGVGTLKTQSFNLCPFLTLSVKNGSSVSFGTNVPCFYIFKYPLLFDHSLTWI